MKSSLLRKVVIGTFLSVPLISSIISTIHLIDLFNLGNPTWLSILLAVTFELGSIASLLAISVIEKIKVGAIWFIFFILSALQIIGNVYYSYSFTSDQILANQQFLTNFMDLFSFITGDDIRDVKIFLSCIIGIPIPLIALFFLKSNIDYLKPEPKGGAVAQSVEKKEEPKIGTTNQQTDQPEVFLQQPDVVQEAPNDEVSVIDELTEEAQSLGMYEPEDVEEHVIIRHVESHESKEPIVEDLDQESIEPSEEPDSEENTIKRNRDPKKNPGRFIFDERGVKQYNA